MLYQVFPVHLRYARSVRGLSLLDLEYRTRLPLASLRRYEKGDQLPHTTTLYQLAKALRVSTDFLLGLSYEIDVPTGFLKIFPLGKGFLSIHVSTDLLQLPEKEQKFVLNLLERAQEYTKVEESTDRPTAPPVIAPVGKNPAAVVLGKLGGQKGGRARAENLTPERRTEIAQIAVKKRWETFYQEIRKK